MSFVLLSSAIAGGISQIVVEAEDELRKGVCARCVKRERKQDAIESSKW